MNEIHLVEIVFKNRKRASGYYIERKVQGELDSIVIAAEFDPETNKGNYLIEYEIEKIKSIYSFLDGDYVYKLD